MKIINHKLLVYEYPNWILILKSLSHGRICPICGKIYKNRFLSHLSYHGLTQLWYLLKLLGLDSVPLCSICGNQCSINTHGYYFNNTCSNNHCMHSMSNHTRVANGNHNFAYSGDKVLDKAKYEKLHDAAMKRIKRGNNILAYNGDRDHDEMVLKFHRNKLIGRDHIKYSGWHSRPENLLAEVLSKLSIYYIREVEYNNQLYRVDYLLPDYNKILECDGLFKYHDGVLDKKYLDRSRSIELLTGFDVINIPSNMIYFYNKFPRKLWELIKYPKYKLIIV